MATIVSKGGLPGGCCHRGGGWLGGIVPIKKDDVTILTPDKGTGD